MVPTRKKKDLLDIFKNDFPHNGMIFSSIAAATTGLWPESDTENCCQEPTFELYTYKHWFERIIAQPLEIPDLIGVRYNGTTYV